MASRVLMPRLTDTMEEGVLIRWYKHEGERVESGDALAEIETDKAVMDLEAYASGILRKVLVSEGAHVPAGNLIAVIGRADEDIGAMLGPEAPAGVQISPAPKIAAEAPGPAAPAGEKAAVAETAQAIPIRERPKPGLKASPLARRLASELGVALTGIQGTGPQGRITRADVEKAAGRKPPEAAPGVLRAGAGEPAPPAAAGDREVVLTPMRRAIVRKMAQSKAPVPHFYVTSQIAMDRALDLRAQLKEAWATDPPSITALVLKACTLALQKVPEINASFGEDRIILHREIHLGIAVGLEEGLIVPVLRNCERKGIRQLSTESEQLIARARTRKIRPEEYAGATFSVSNLGMFGVDNFIAVITPPEAAALAVGRVREQPVLREGRIDPGRSMEVTLSCDHRVIDGVQAARFLQEFRQALEQPFRLVSGTEPAGG